MPTGAALRDQTVIVRAGDAEHRMPRWALDAVLSGRLPKTARTLDRNLTVVDGEREHAIPRWAFDAVREEAAAVSQTNDFERRVRALSGPTLFSNVVNPPAPGIRAVAMEEMQRRADGIDDRYHPRAWYARRVQDAIARISRQQQPASMNVDAPSVGL